MLKNLQQKIKDIKLHHLQAIIDECALSYQTKKLIRTFLKQLFDYAIAHDWIAKSYVEFINIGKNNAIPLHRPFTNEELKTLWDNINVDFVDTVLIMIYTGMRVEELLQLRKEDINLKNWTITGGVKTEAGRNRIIPIPNKIKNILVAGHEKCNRFLLEIEEQRISYIDYRKIAWDPLMDFFKMRHLPHDCRHTFITLADNAGANETAIKKIVGHALAGTTKKVYTHKDIEQLRIAINAI